MGRLPIPLVAVRGLLIDTDITMKSKKYIPFLILILSTVDYDLFNVYEILFAKVKI